MVGWNVATTQLVAGQASPQDKYFLCLIFATVFVLMNYMNMLNALMNVFAYVVFAIVMHLQMFYVQCIFYYVYVHGDSFPI